MKKGKKDFKLKRVIWNNFSFYSLSDKEQEEYKRYLIAEGLEDEDVTDEQVAQHWLDDIDINFDDEEDNLSHGFLENDGCILAMLKRSSHYGAIGGSGREGLKICGHSLAAIMHIHAGSDTEDMDVYAQDYNIHAKLYDHDGYNHIVFRVCKDDYEAEKLIHKFQIGEIKFDTIMKRTKSLYPLVADVYGWPVIERKNVKK